MFDWLMMLFPEFSTTTGMLTWFVMVIVWAIAIAALFWIVRRRSEVKARIAALRQLVAAASGQASQCELRRAANDSDAVVRAVWTEFDETLVTIGDPERLHNTVDAEVYFNERTLAADLTGNRLLAAVPSILTAFGVLGTFLGLVVGLSGLHASDALTGTAEADSLAVGIEELIGAAGTAFVTSVWGVVASIIVNVVEKLAERWAAGEIAQIQVDIDGVFSKLTPESTLVRIEAASVEAQYALQTLDEKIGDRLQIGIDSMSDKLNEAIVSSIGPAMEQLVSRTTSQGAEVFESLVERFASSFTDLGDRQARAMENAAGALGRRLDELGSSITAVRETYELTLAELGALRDALGTSAAKLSGSADALDQAGARLANATSEAGSMLSGASDRLGVMMQRTAGQLGRLAEEREAAEKTHSALALTAAGMHSATERFADRLEDFGDVQRRFHSDIEATASTMANLLRGQVETLEERASSWLTAYAQQVERQVADRMGVWNTHSQEYANQMLNVAGALNDVIESLDSRLPLPVEAKEIA